MLLYHFKQALRSLQKNKVFSFFNIAGFAIGFAVCIVTALYVHNETTVNDFFPDPQNTYRLVDEGKETHLIDRAVAPLIGEQIPEILDIVPMAYIYDDDMGEVIKIGNRYMEFKEMISTTNNFFQFMGIPILASSQKKPFAGKNSVVISRSAAIRLFGHYDILGEPVSFLGIKFTVSSIAGDIPANASFGADVYISDELDEIGFVQSCDDNGCYLMREIYFRVKGGTDINLLKQKMNDNFPKNKTNTKLVSFQPVKSIYFSAPLDEFNQNKTGNKKFLWIFITIAALTLFMSVFNYVNYTISKQLKTLKETGIRITTGAGKKQILGYYFVEVGLSVLIAFALALVVADMALPVVEGLLNTNLSLGWLLKADLVLAMLALLFIVIFLSVWFPARVILRTGIIALLSKRPGRISASALSNIMSVTQLVISIALLSGLLTINKQLKYVKTANYGFATNQLLRILIPFDEAAFNSGSNNYKIIKDEFSQLPIIKNLTLTSHSPGSGWSRNSAKKSNGDTFYINMVSIDDNFIKTFEMNLLSGREPMASDLNNALLITETTLKMLEWDTFEGRQLMGLNVIGVVNDLNYNSMHSGIIPVAFFYSDSYYDAINVQLLPGDFKEQLKHLEAAWQRAGYDDPIKFQFYSDYYQSLYQKEEREAQALTIFSIVAFVITCIGLLGQVMQVSERKIKEIGIRKINGATTKQVVLMLIRNFAFWVGIAFVIATPIAWYAMSRWLENFAYKTALSWWIFALAGLLSLLVALLTVSWQSWRAATRNPVEALRYE